MICYCKLLKYLVAVIFNCHGFALLQTWSFPLLPTQTLCKFTHLPRYFRLVFRHCEFSAKSEWIIFLRQGFKYANKKLSKKWIFNRSAMISLIPLNADVAIATRRYVSVSLTEFLWVTNVLIFRQLPAPFLYLVFAHFIKKNNTFRLVRTLQ